MSNDPPSNPRGGAGGAPSSETPADTLPAEDFLSQLARRLCGPPQVHPQLGLRFAPTPDLPDEDTAAWRRRWLASTKTDPGEKR